MHARVAAWTRKSQGRRVNSRASQCRFSANTLTRAWLGACDARSSLSLHVVLGVHALHVVTGAHALHVARGAHALRRATSSAPDTRATRALLSTGAHVSSKADRTGRAGAGTTALHLRRCDRARTTSAARRRQCAARRMMRGASMCCTAQGVWGGCTMRRAAHDAWGGAQCKGRGAPCSPQLKQARDPPGAPSLSPKSFDSSPARAVVPCTHASKDAWAGGAMDGWMDGC